MENIKLLFSIARCASLSLVLMLNIAVCAAALRLTNIDMRRSTLAFYLNTARSVIPLAGQEK